MALHFKWDTLNFFLFKCKEASHKHQHLLAHMQLKTIVFIPVFDTATKVKLQAGTKPVSREYQSLLSFSLNILSPPVFMQEDQRENRMQRMCLLLDTSQGHVTRWCLMIQWQECLLQPGTQQRWQGISPLGCDAGMVCALRAVVKDKEEEITWHSSSTIPGHRNLPDKASMSPGQKAAILGPTQPCSWLSYFKPRL